MRSALQPAGDTINRKDRKGLKELQMFFFEVFADLAVQSLYLIFHSFQDGKSLIRNLGGQRFFPNTSNLWLPLIPLELFAQELEEGAAGCLDQAER